MRRLDLKTTMFKVSIVLFVGIQVCFAYHYHYRGLIDRKYGDNLRPNERALILAAHKFKLSKQILTICVGNAEMSAALVKPFKKARDLCDETLNESSHRGKKYWKESPFTRKEKKDIVLDIKRHQRMSEPEKEAYLGRFFEAGKKIVKQYQELVKHLDSKLTSPLMTRERDEKKWARVEAIDF